MTIPCLVAIHDNIIQEGGVDVVALTYSNVLLTIPEQNPVLWMFIRILYDIPVYIS